MSEEEAREIAGDIVDHLIEVGAVKNPDNNELYVWDIITSRLLICTNPEDHE